MYEPSNKANEKKPIVFHASNARYFFNMISCSRIRVFCFVAIL